MKRIAIWLCGGLALAGCTSQEDQLENAIRENLASRGNVTEVEMTQEGENMSGHAVVRLANGTDSRLTCTATSDPAKGSDYYNWRCVRTIDEATLTEMEDTIRQALVRQGGQVQQVEMTRQDDNTMTGYALVSDGVRQIRTNCSATRSEDGQNDFSWQCQPGQ